MNVSVDDDFARFGSKSYAINKINSVEVRMARPHNSGGAVLCACLAALLLLVWLGSIAAPEGINWSLLLVAAVFAGLAYWSWQKSKIRVYHLFLMTSSSEAEALTSNDRGYIEGLRDQIERAMTRAARNEYAR